MKAVQVGGRGFDCNQFLLKDDKTNQYDMVDAGHGQDWDQVLHEVSKLIDPHRVKTIAITHEHMDHVNGLPRWQQLGARIVCAPAVADKLAVGHDPTSARFGMDIPKMVVDETAHDGDDVLLGGMAHKVLLTPGHSPGSACYWDEKHGTLFAGDTLFAQGGIGRFDFPDGNLAQLAESVHRLGALPIKTLHCGHGPSVEGDDASRSSRASMAHVDSCVAQNRES